MNKADVNIFEKLSGQLISIYEEISLLSKKSPNDAVNKFKLKFINKLLDESNVFLSNSYKPFNDFNHFEEDDVPQNSDVVLILAQYIQCFEKLRSDNVIMRRGIWCWRLKANKNDRGAEDGMIYIKTTTPKRLKD